MNKAKFQEFIQYFKAIDPNTYNYKSIGTYDSPDCCYENQYCIGGHASIWAKNQANAVHLAFSEIFETSIDVAEKVVFESMDSAGNHKSAVKFLTEFAKNLP